MIPVQNVDSTELREAPAGQPASAPQSTSTRAKSRTRRRTLKDWLFPDYNDAAILYWCVLVFAGTGVVVAAVVHLIALPNAQVADVVVIGSIAALVALFPLRIPKSKNSIAAGDVFIFLLLMLHGPWAAALAAAAESGVCAWRTSKRWSSRLASPAAAASAMLICGTGFVLMRAVATKSALGDDAGTFAALMVFALSYFVVSPTLVTTVIFLKRRRAPTLREWLEGFGWIGLGYVGSASVTGVLHLAFRQFGVSTVIYAAPIVGMFLATLHYYFARQEADEREIAARANRERAEEAERHLRDLEESDKRFHSAFTHAAIGMALTAADGTVLQANQALCALIGRSEQDVVGKRFREFLNPLDAAPLEQELRRVHNIEIDGFQVELRLRQADRREIWASLHCGLFRDKGGGDACLIFQAFDVTARRLAEARMQHMAYHDGLTNLANRGRLHEALAQAIEARRNDPARSFAVVYLTLDRLRLLNDSFGFSAGDQVLIRAARQLKGLVRPDDVVARLGGDEFAILTHCCDNPAAAGATLAERVLKSLAEPFEVEGTEVATSVSVGITVSDIGYLTPEDALRDADLARRRAKVSAKPAAVLFDGSLHDRAKEKLLLEAELRRAIAANQLSLVLQPIFEIASQSVVGFEALARWEHPERGAVSPGVFIPVAEESGLIGPLTQWAIRRACQTLRGWLDRFPTLQHLYVNVNISGHDLCDPRFADSVHATLREYRVPPQSLTLEITENTLMHQLEIGSNTLARLRELGVGLSVDDFGTGYSSLSYLSALPVNSLKIDRSFVVKLDGSVNEAEIVRAVVRLGDALGKRIIAEGVETASQLEQLREIGCEFAQGYHLGRPLTKPQALALLEQVAQIEVAHQVISKVGERDKVAR